MSIRRHEQRQHAQNLSITSKVSLPSTPPESMWKVKLKACVWPYERLAEAFNENGGQLYALQYTETEQD